MSSVFVETLCLMSWFTMAMATGWPQVVSLMLDLLVSPSLKLTYYWWFRNPASPGMVLKPVVNNGIIYHISWCRILSINSSTWKVVGRWMSFWDEMSFVQGQTVDSGECRDGKNIWQKKYIETTRTMMFCGIPGATAWSWRPDLQVLLRSHAFFVGSKYSHYP